MYHSRYPGLWAKIHCHLDVASTLRRKSKLEGGMRALKIIPLVGSLQPLKDRFNSDNGKLRFIALLSPT